MLRNSLVADGTLDLRSSLSAEEACGCYRYKPAWTQPLCLLKRDRGLALQTDKTYKTTRYRPDRQEKTRRLAYLSVFISVCLSVICLSECLSSVCLLCEQPHVRDVRFPRMVADRCFPVHG